MLKSYSWLIIFYLIGKITLFFFQCTSPIQNILTLSSIWSVKSTCFFPGGLLQPGFPFEQTMSCHILYVVKMAYRYLLMFYVHTLLVSIQLRSQYHKKNQVPWCWNHIGWLIIFCVIGKITLFFSVYIPNSKYIDISFYLIGKSACFFSWWAAPTEDPLWTNHVLPYFICG